jgi:hypothetical protein
MGFENCRSLVGRSRVFLYHFWRWPMFREVSWTEVDKAADGARPHDYLLSPPG